MDNNIGTIKKARIEYIDAMRGFAMFTVIYGHITLLVFHVKTICFDIICSFHMPLFFFICGFMSYSSYTKQLMKKRIRNRILCQLLPTIIVATLYCLSFSIPFDTVITDIMKAGYWFTFVMVELFLFYMLYISITNRYKINITSQTLFLIFLILGSNIIKSLLFKYNIFTHPIALITSFPLIVIHLPYFIFGILAKMHFDLFLKILHHRYSILFALSAFIGLFFYDPFGRSAFIQGFLGIIIVYRFFEFYKIFFSNQTFIGRSLGYIGKYTLEIYLIHYFFIHSLKEYAQYVDINAIYSSWIVELIIFTIISIIILGLSLCTIKFTKISPILYSLLFGFKK